MEISQKNICIPKGFIVFISGVPGAGKTTISYELLCLFEQFRIVEETDLIRETLRGYNSYLETYESDEISSLDNNVIIFDHNKLLSFGEAKLQCKHMKNSLVNIVKRQQRKGISTIINGVHIIPEVLGESFTNSGIIFINLHITNEKTFYKRISERNPNSYMLNQIPLIYKTNLDLFESTMRLSKLNDNKYHNIDVTNLSIKETMQKVFHIIENITNLQR